MILCPGMDCIDCAGNPLPSKCKKVRADELDKIVIVEKDKKRVHLRTGSAEFLEDQLNLGNFEPVFIERFDEIEEWDNLIGAYLIESYLALFFKDYKECNVQYYSFPRVKTTLEYSLIEEMSRKFRKDFEDVDFLWKVGERIITTERLINIREGFKRTDDMLPERMLTEPLHTNGADGEGQMVTNINQFLDNYYKARGWTVEGIPGKQKLVELGIEN